VATVNPLKKIVEKYKQGIPNGIYSVCSANEYVLEAAMDTAAESNDYVLIEATANQVNQFGGYTGMKPIDFSEFVFGIADKVKFPREKIILGGDHLGPLVWKSECSQVAMELSLKLITEYVKAGFTKIHLDTSMHLGDDDKSMKLDKSIIAQRGAMLCQAAEYAFNTLKEENANAIHPVYVIGSEVPIPGGSQEAEGKIQVTEIYDFEETVEVYKNMFIKYGLNSAWENVIAVVVQPGVEFGDDTICEYDREAASGLSNALKKYTNLVFEGHSTDYQTSDCLKQMVEDGIVILKVGPALTFAFREALFMLTNIEEALFKYNPEVRLSNFINVLETEMLKHPENWEKHYHGSAAKRRFAMKFSLSDRSRYYIPAPIVKESIELLIGNLESVNIPLTLIDLYMPVQYTKIRKGILKNNPVELLKDRVINVLDDYHYAVNGFVKRSK
jgi:D-tagatose-1,6-bisphosphate aldolase subunit GatZ/KbaZ